MTSNSSATEPSPRSLTQTQNADGEARVHAAAKERMRRIRDALFAKEGEVQLPSDDEIEALILYAALTKAPPDKGAAKSRAESIDLLKIVYSKRITRLRAAPKGVPLAPPSGTSGSPTNGTESEDDEIDLVPRPVV